ncbi:Protein kinase-like domain containing protein [Russula decolorans]
MPEQHIAVGAKTITTDIVRVGGRYRVGKLLGAGTFGTVYLGRDIKKGRDVAVKLEAAQEWGSKLEHEYHVYRATSGIRGIPKMLWYGVEGRYNVMVLSHLGCTFKEMAQLGVLDANAVFTYAKQMVFSPCARSTLLFTSHSKLSVLKSLHDHHYVHLDVKPDNFMIGTGDRSSRVFLIDFGLTRLFRNPATRKHITQFKGLDITGTVRYSSINSHLGLTQSRRDDLESLAYAIVYLVKGRLPWQGIAVHPGQVHHDEVLKLKQVTTAKTLCKGLPQPFIEFIQHIRSLGFEDKPDYRYLHSLLTQCILPLNQMPPTTWTEPLLLDNILGEFTFFQDG